MRSAVGAVDALPAAAFDKPLRQNGVQLAVPDREAQDAEGLLHRLRLFIGAVGGGEGVEDVQNRDDPDLPGDFRPFQALGVASAVELLVVGRGLGADVGQLR